MISASFGDVLCLVREMGPAWLVWRALYEAELRSGLLCKRFWPRPIDRLLARSLGVAPPDLNHYLFEKWEKVGSHFFVDRDLSHYREAVFNPDRVLEIANAALEGRFLFFSRWWADLGNPPDWLLNPVDGVRYPGDIHWSLIPDLSPELGDIKYVWEASRFPHVYYFVRAYVLTGDERYAEGFWNHVESWVRANPPELGPNWRCGQEIAIRSFAWIFGLYAFRGCRATTPRRVALLLKYLWYNAWHIERNHWYALRCVRNNHSLSEAAGMFTIGTLFPFFKEAARWREKGFRHLVKEAMWQIYPDGSYMQHSMNYARLVVQLFTWCVRVGRVNCVDFPESLRGRLRRLLAFLASVQDAGTGRVPNYGSNDGALIFPLSSCDYLDYRPALNALNVVLDGERLYEPGPWDEEAAWFCGPDMVLVQGVINQPGCPDIGCPTSTSSSSHVQGKREVVCISRAFPMGGYYVLRDVDTFGMIRCGKYQHRPSQADMFHLDVWYRGRNILVDPGSFSYNLPPKWSDYFVGTAAHNTVTVDGKNQMKKGSRFIWTNWVHGDTLRFEAGHSQILFEGEHRGYAPVVHRRLVILRNDVWVVVDDLFGDSAEHTYVLHWLVGDFALDCYGNGADICLYSDSDGVDGSGRGMTDANAKSPWQCRLSLRVACSRPANGRWVRADEDTPRGWQSVYYGEKLPAWSYQLRVVSAEHVRFVTVLGPAGQVGDMDPLAVGRF